MAVVRTTMTTQESRGPEPFSPKEATAPWKFPSAALSFLQACTTRIPLLHSAIMDTKAFLDAILSDPAFVRGSAALREQNAGQPNVEDALGSLIGQVLGTVVEGAANDIIVLRDQISYDLSRVILAPEDKQAEMLTELYGQMKALLELNRLRVVAAQAEALPKIIATVTRSLLAGVVLAL